MIVAAGGHDGYRIFDSVECYDTHTDKYENTIYHFEFFSNIFYSYQKDGIL
jgi:hypothetical protein